MQWRRRIAGFVWLLVWMVVLYLVAAPWRALGGLVDERIRWLEAFVLWNGLVVGFVIGRFGRDAVVAGHGRTHARLLRWMLYPPGVLAVIGLLVLTALGERGAAGVLVSALLAYWAGLDLAFGAVPLMEGKPYRFDAPIEREPEARRQREDWSAPWTGI